MEASSFVSRIFRLRGRFATSRIFSVFRVCCAPPTHRRARRDDTFSPNSPVGTYSSTVECGSARKAMDRDGRGTGFKAGCEEASDCSASIAGICLQSCGTSSDRDLGSLCAFTHTQHIQDTLFMGLSFVAVKTARFAASKAAWIDNLKPKTPQTAQEGVECCSDACHLMSLVIASTQAPRS